jgi:hypothetical protein
MSKHDKSDHAPDPAPAVTPTAETDALVERWFADHFHGSPLARDTATYNLVHAAKEELKQRLAQPRARGAQ